MTPAQLTPSFLLGILSGAEPIYILRFTKVIGLVLFQAVLVSLVFLAGFMVLAIISTAMISLVWIYAIVASGHVFNLPLVSPGSTYTFKKVTSFAISFGIVAVIGRSLLICTLRNWYLLYSSLIELKELGVNSRTPAAQVQPPVYFKQTLPANLLDASATKGLLSSEDGSDLIPRKLECATHAVVMKLEESRCYCDAKLSSARHSPAVQNPSPDRKRTSQITLSGLHIVTIGTFGSNENAERFKNRYAACGNSSQIAIQVLDSQELCDVSATNLQTLEVAALV